MLNIRQDQKEQLDIITHLCRFIRPDAFSDLKDDPNVVKSVSTDISQQLTSKGLSSEELDLIVNQDLTQLEQLDTIERVDRR